MYKHTFYYFLGNKKYPEIYILQAWKTQHTEAHGPDLDATKDTKLA